MEELYKCDHCGEEFEIDEMNELDEPLTIENDEGSYTVSDVCDFCVDVLEEEGLVERVDE